VTARQPWDAPLSPTLDASAERAGAMVADTVRTAYADGRFAGWLACRREMYERLAELDARIIEMRIEAAGVRAERDYLVVEWQRQQAEVDRAGTLAGALVRAEHEVATLRREVAQLKGLAGLPEAM